ncbi:SLBB domain-containing protein [bacterium]|nr:SLBB domain-containing protein [bacterium]
MRALALVAALGVAFAFGAGCKGTEVFDPNRDKDIGPLPPAADVIVPGERLPLLAPPPPPDNLEDLMGKDESIVERMRVGDVVSVQVREEPELSQAKARVGRDGILRLPWLGRLEVLGKTRAQVEADITQLLQKDYVNKADVSVELIPEECRKIYVLGRVARPGVLTLPVDRRLTLLQVIALAGGLATAKLDLEADASAIQLIRVINGKRRTFTLSFDQILDRQQLEREIFIDPEDVIYIPPKKELYVFGSVIRPGAFPLNAESRLTIDEALSLAGGFGPVAERDRVTVIRRAATGGANSYQVDMRDEKQRATAQVTANDTIIVADRQVRRVYVLGLVERSGAFEIDERGLTVIKALALAGGLKRIADGNNTLLLRATPQGRIKRRILVDKIIKDGDLEKDPPLVPGDIIYVPEGFF